MDLLSNTPPEIWWLIFRALPTQNDLVEVGRVCKLFDMLATPLLYQSVIFRSSMFNKYLNWAEFPGDIELSEPGLVPLRFNPFYRLLDDRNEVLRAFVRKITIEDWRNTDKSLVWSKLQAPQNLLARLVEKLPNLEEICFEGEFPITDELINAMLAHKKSPKLYLRGEDGHTRITNSIPVVPEVRIRVEAEATPPEMDDDDDDFVPQRLALHEIFAAFPNLESLSISVNRLVGGCMVDPGPRCTQILPLSLPENATIPPLQSLSLSGYEIQGNELLTWKTRFPWDKLKALSLGVQENPGVLEAATGNVHDLREFEISGYCFDWHEPEVPRDLEAFLSSFHSLESFIAKGPVPPISSVIHHFNLKHLCLHTIETPDYERPTLSVEEVESLDQHLPMLNSLEIDMGPKDTWPENKVIEAIATRFQNLRQISIHFGLRIALAVNQKMEYAKLVNSRSTDSTEIFIAQTMGPGQFFVLLTEESAYKFVKQFLGYRGPSNLKKFTLKTGENLRWYPQWPSTYSEEEKDCAKIFELYPPHTQGGEIRLKELETEYARFQRSLNRIHYRPGHGNGNVDTSQQINHPRILKWRGPPA